MPKDIWQAVLLYSSSIIYLIAKPSVVSGRPVDFNFCLILNQLTQPSLQSSFEVPDLKSLGAEGYVGGHFIFIFSSIFYLLAEPSVESGLSKCLLFDFSVAKDIRTAV